MVTMVDATPQNDGRARFADFGIARPHAFVDAGRHTDRVRFFRRAIIVCCISTVGLILFVYLFDPLHRLGGGLSVGRVGLDGNRITMDSPRISGSRTDGLPYEVKAGSAVQDTTKPSIFELTDVDVRLGLSDGSTTTMVASTGTYSSDLDRLSVSGRVRIRNEGRYDMLLKSAVMDLKAGEMQSDKPVAVDLPDGRIEADAVQSFENGQKLVFNGNVRTVLNPRGDDEPAPDAPKAGTKP